MLFVDVKDTVLLKYTSSLSIANQLKDVIPIFIASLHAKQNPSKQRLVSKMDTTPFSYFIAYICVTTVLYVGLLLLVRPQIILGIRLDVKYTEKILALIKIIITVYKKPWW